MKLKSTKKGGVLLLKINKPIYILLLLFLAVYQSSAQEFSSDSLTVTDSVVVSEFPFINYEADTLIDATLLTPFFSKLLKLENGDSSIVNIVHIGDSHIQADYITREVRKNMQLKFGNAGRGLVFPLRVAGTNEPADYRSASNVGWSVSKINSAAKNPEPGISGISMRTNSGGSYFEISTFSHDDLDYSFNKVTLLHSKDSTQFDWRFTVSPERFGYLMSSRPSEAGENTTEVQLPSPTSFIRLQAEHTEMCQNSATVNGVVLQNNKPGVLYHSIGINGAHFADYNSSPLFFSQLSALTPDLVIVSLGTNEGANIKMTAEEMQASVSFFIRNIRQQVPQAVILITTPVDDFLRKKYKNPYLETVQRSLVKAAAETGVACWDLYTIGGGYGSASNWKSAGMLQRDGVHFNKQGYTLQGTLLFNALNYSYQRYAAD